MTSRLRNAALAVTALMAVPAIATAQNLVEMASQWGLIGTWALDCTKPPSSGNGYLTYAIRRAGQVTHERNFGDRQDVNQVEQVKLGAGGAIEVVVNFPGLGQARKLTLIMGPDGRTRAMSNSRADGSEPTIKDGKFTHNGSETPWQVRCR